MLRWLAAYKGDAPSAVLELEKEIEKWSSSLEPGKQTWEKISAIGLASALIFELNKISFGTR